MSLLIIALPPGPAAATGSYAWVTSVDGHTPGAHGDAAAALLPPAGRGVEIVACVPAARLSWHQVELPRGLGPRSPRLRAALAGLLEERLLDDPDQLHFALQPHPAVDGRTWVAACRRDWLDAHLEVLAAAGYAVARVVPELAPTDGAPQLMVTGEPGRAQLLASGAGIPGGMQALPLDTGALALLRTSLDPAAAATLEAEPAVAVVAEQVLGGAPALLAPAERLLRTSASNWNLAQGELARTGATWAARRAGASWRDFLHAPRWRPARWGLVVLVLAQLLGLNLWAWRTQGALQAQRTEISAMLTETFPQVRVVVDPPVQMERELATLRQGAGTLSPRDLEPMLAAYGRVAPAGQAPAMLEFTSGELRLKGLDWPADVQAQARATLRPLGYRLQVEGGDIVLREGPTP